MLERVYQTTISTPKLAECLVPLFRFGLSWYTIDIYCSAISAFLQYQHPEASNHPVIFKLMHNFYLQHPPSCKHFAPWDIEHLLFL